MDDCNCPNRTLSDFDEGMLQSFDDGALNVMPGKVVINGNELNCVVTERTLAQNNIQGGKKVLIAAAVEVRKDDFLRASGNILGGDPVTFSDGQTAKVSIVDDADGPVLTLRLVPRLDGSAGPQGGNW